MPIFLKNHQSRRQKRRKMSNRERIHQWCNVPSFPCWSPVGMFCKQLHRVTWLGSGGCLSKITTTAVTITIILLILVLIIIKMSSDTFIRLVTYVLCRPNISTNSLSQVMSCYIINNKKSHQSKCSLKLQTLIGSSSGPLAAIATAVLRCILYTVH